MKPSYKHDCKKCKFVGKLFRALNEEGTRRKSTDVYKSCEDYGSKYIIRCSNSPSDYITTNTLDPYIVYPSGFMPLPIRRTQ